MLKAKILALCACPVVATPPVVLAVHPPARHVVAHLLHHAANRLDHEVRPAAGVVAAALPCAPSLAAGGGGLPAGGDLLLGGTERSLALGAAGLPAGGGGAAGWTSGGGYGGPTRGGGYGGGGYGGGGGPATGVGGGGGPATGFGGGSTGGTAAGGDAIIPTMHAGILPVAAQVSGAPEPAAWALLVVGFGLVGAVTRHGRAGRRLATGAAGED